MTAGDPGLQRQADAVSRDAGSRQNPLGPGSAVGPGKGNAMQIKQMTIGDVDVWERFVASHPRSTFYHRAQWKKIIEESFGHPTYYLMAYDGGELRGVLPLVHLKSMLFGSILCSMPFLNFGGVCASDEHAEHSLLDEARRILKTVDGAYLELRQLHRTRLHLPTKTHKVSMTLQLAQDPEQLWKAFKSKHRTNIRRAAKNELEIRRGGKEFLDPFYRILSIGWRDLGTPLYKRSFFETILTVMESAVEIYLVLYRGKAIATAFNGLFGDTVEGMWTYCLKDFSRLQTNYFLYWEMIKNACERGYQHFHLGRSTNDTGATFYKKKWNAEAHPLYWEYVLHRAGDIPELNVENPKYQWAIRTWRRLPIFTTRLLGPPLAKSIP